MTNAATELVTVRIEYAKGGRLRFIGHLDTARLLVRAVRASGLPARMTQGHSPRIEVSFGPALPLGATADSEFFDVRLTEAVDPAAARQALAAHMPDGIEIHAVRLIAGKAESLGLVLNRADFALELPPELTVEPSAIEQFLASEQIPVVRTRSGRDKTVNIRPWVERLELCDVAGGGARLEITIVITPQGSANPLEVLGVLAGPDAARHSGVRVHRQRLYRDGDGTSPG